MTDMLMIATPFFRGYSTDTMFFQSDVSRNRHAYIEKSLGTTLEVLRTSTAQAHMGELALELAGVIEDNLYIADVRHGKVIAPRRLDDDRVPTIALAIGESVTIDPKLQMQTPMQEALTREELGDVVLDKRVARGLRSHASHSAPSWLSRRRIASEAVGDVSASAYVASGAFTIDNLATLSDGVPFQPYFNTRPLLALVERGPDETCKSPDTIAHEAQHVIDSIYDPVFLSSTPEYNWRRQLRSELRGYCAQARCIRGMIALNYRHLPGERESYIPDETTEGAYYSRALAIDALRVAANAKKDDPFETNDELVDSLVATDLASIVAPSSI